MIKIPDTLQEVFDIVSTHLLKQVKRSMGKVLKIETETCAYRGKNEMKCAAGALIPDDQYKSVFEGSFWEDLARMEFVEPKFVEEISELQSIHDENHNDDVDYLKTKLVKFAETHNLQINFEV